MAMAMAWNTATTLGSDVANPAHRRTSLPSPLVLLPWPDQLWQQPWEESRGPQSPLPSCVGGTLVSAC